MFNQNPYWIAAKYAFVVAAAGGAALAAIKGFGAIIERGLGGFLGGVSDVSTGGMASDGVLTGDDTETTEDKTTV